MAIKLVAIFLVAMVVFIVGARWVPQRPSTLHEVVVRIKPNIDEFVKALAKLSIALVDMAGATKRMVRAYRKGQS